MIGTYLVHGWMHLFMVQVDYRLFGTVGTWLMHLFIVQVEVQVDAWFRLIGTGL